MQPMRTNEVEIQHPIWNVRGRALVLDRVFVMGIVNITPDSFADGGRHFNHANALARARQLIERVPTLSTSEASRHVRVRRLSPDEEIRRVVPLLEALAGTVTPLSVDTSKPEVMRAALAPALRSSMTCERCSSRPRPRLLRNMTAALG